VADKRLIARIVRQNGGKLLDRALGKLLADNAPTPAAKPSLKGRLAGAALVRIATRSVPGAIVVGGAMLAKSLRDRHKAQHAAPAKPDKP
jgi:hypothetical protein